jgi:hypothetical protein
MTYPSFSSGEVLRATDMNAVGMWKVGTFTASGTSRALVCDNVFTSDYRNYKVVIKMGGVSNTNWLYFQFIDTAGTTVSGSYFATAYLRDFTAGSTAVGVINTSGSVPLGYMANGVSNPTGAEVTIYGPRQAEWTTVNGQTTGISSGVAYQAGEIYATCNPTPNTLRGLRFDNIAGTNMTGTVTIYGYNN